MYIHDGHRKRVRTEFLANGLTGVSEHRALELLLFYAIPKGDVNPLAHTLIDHFGSLSGVFDATHEQLLTVPGVGEYTAVLIKLIPALGRCYRLSRKQAGCVVQSPRELKDIFLPHFFAARNEMAFLACMDAGGRLLGVRKLGEGSACGAEITGRKVVETALALNASMVALAHNHLSGIASPSEEDISTTRYLSELLEKVSVELFDHVVVVDDDMISLRELGLLSPFACC